MTTTTPHTAPTYDECRAAQARLIPLLVKRLPKPLMHLTLNVLSVPIVRGGPRFKERRHADVAVDFAMHGLLRHGRNFCEQQLSASWPADRLEREVLKGAGGARYLFAKVESIREGDGVDAVDIAGTAVSISDRALSRAAQPGMGLAGFVFGAAGHRMLTGAPFIITWEAVQPQLAQAVARGILHGATAAITPEQRAGEMNYAASFVGAMLTM